MTHRNAADTATRDASADLEWRGSWNELTGKIKQVWGDAIGDPGTVAEGNFREMLGWLQRETGEGIDSIRKKLF